MPSAGKVWEDLVQWFGTDNIEENIRKAKVGFSISHRVWGYKYIRIKALNEY